MEESFKEGFLSSKNSHKIHFSNAHKITSVTHRIISFYNRTSNEVRTFEIKKISDKFKHFLIYFRSLRSLRSLLSLPSLISPSTVHLQKIIPGKRWSFTGAQPLLYHFSPLSLNCAHSKNNS